MDTALQFGVIVISEQIAAAAASTHDMPVLECCVQNGLKVLHQAVYHSLVIGKCVKHSLFLRP